MKNKEIKLYYEFVESVSKLSYCERLKVGSVIVRGNSILGYGYNGSAMGDDNVCELDGVTKPGIIHAEKNAIYKVARSHESSEGAAIFITHSPCMECSVALVQCGIKEVYYITPYRDPAPIEYLKSKGIQVYQKDKIEGLINE